jgi:hypothetical protein
MQLNTLSSVLAVLTALIAPALLLSACGTFISSTATRLSLNTERARTLVHQLKKMESQGEDTHRAEPRFWFERQLDLTFQRVLLEQWALGLFYSAALLFVACSLALGMEAISKVPPPALPVALGLAGVLLLLAACTLLVLDLHRLVTAMREEIALVRRRPVT